MIEREFSDAEGAKSIGFSGSDFNFVVKALNDTAGELLFGLEVVENERPMSAEHFGDFLHGLDTGAHDLFTPDIEIQAGPGGGVVVPETMEVLFEQIGADGLQVVAKQIIKPEPLFGGEIGGALEETPA